MATSADTYRTTLARYLPQVAVEPVFQFLTQTHQVKFRISTQRISKLGDYRWPTKGHEYHEISVNGNLNSYYFLRVLIHEMAHLLTWERYGSNIKPHGHEWQLEYARLLLSYCALPQLNGTVSAFPEDVTLIIKSYVRHLPLKRALKDQLDQALRRYDTDYQEPQEPTLMSIPLGSCFMLKERPNRIFQSLEKRRTNVKCLSTDGRLYLVKGSARVVVVPPKK